MIIKASTVGTPQQPNVPKNEIADVEAGAVQFEDQGVASLALKLPSAAGIPGYFDYWRICNSLNPGVWGGYSFNSTAIATAQALSNAAQQEWVSNRASGHNVPMGD